MSRRLEFTAKTKLTEWELSGGRCRSCDRKLGASDRKEYDHRIRCEMGGDNSQANCQLLCGWCHDEKTHQQDAPAAAHSRKVRKAEAGAEKPRRPMPGSRASGLKKKLNGTVEKRT